MLTVPLPHSLAQYLTSSLSLCSTLLYNCLSVPLPPCHIAALSNCLSAHCSTASFTLRVPHFLTVTLFCCTTLILPHCLTVIVILSQLLHCPTAMLSLLYCPNCFTAPLPCCHCYIVPTASLSHCLAVIVIFSQLLHCPIVFMSPCLAHHPTAFLPRCRPVSMPYCLTLSQPYCLAVSLSHYFFASMSRCAAVPLPQGFIEKILLDPQGRLRDIKNTAVAKQVWRYFMAAAD
jgi:hypothetical protein